MAARCPYCHKRPLAKNSRGMMLTHCGADTCRRAHDAARKRDYRARKADPMAEPASPDYSGPVATPWGEFPTHKAAWIALPDAIQAIRETRETSGIAAESTESEWDEWADQHLDPDAQPSLNESLGIAPEDDPMSPEWVEDVD